MNHAQRISPWSAFPELLRERGVAEYVALDQTGEGTILPSGFENASAGVLTPDGKITIYVIGWNDAKRAPDGTMGYYDLKMTVPPHVEERADGPYLRARVTLGLPLTSEQERILREWEKERTQS